MTFEDKTYEEVLKGMGYNNINSKYNNFMPIKDMGELTRDEEGNYHATNQ